MRRMLMGLALGAALAYTLGAYAVLQLLGNPDHPDDWFDIDIEGEPLG